MLLPWKILPDILVLFISSTSTPLQKSMKPIFSFLNAPRGVLQASQNRSTVLREKVLCDSIGVSGFFGFFSHVVPRLPSKNRWNQFFWLLISPGASSRLIRIDVRFLEYFILEILTYFLVSSHIWYVDPPPKIDATSFFALKPPRVHPPG